MTIGFFYPLVALAWGQKVNLDTGFQDGACDEESSISFRLTSKKSFTMAKQSSDFYQCTLNLNEATVKLLKAPRISSLHKLQDIFCLFICHLANH